ncbi:hypothetical protein MPSEU_001050900 [Mayamaea pseudoterrestris]|nr:hypothetical protein MPSEU_001050900 [Mayamaea pseudoterrestris]
MSASHYSLPDNPATMRARQEQLHRDMAKLSDECAKAELAFGQPEMHLDWTQNSILLRKRRAEIQAEWRALEKALHGGDQAAAAAETPIIHVAPPQPPARDQVGARSAPSPEENDEDNDAAPEKDEDKRLRADDAGWKDVELFRDGVGMVKVYSRKVDEKDFSNIKTGTIHLQAETTSDKRRFLMRSTNGQAVTLNMLAPKSHQYAEEKKKNKEFGKLTFQGINGAEARGPEVFIIKCNVELAQQLSAELGGRLG